MVPGERRLASPMAGGMTSLLLRHVYAAKWRTQEGCYGSVSARGCQLSAHKFGSADAVQRM